MLTEASYLLLIVGLFVIACLLAAPLGSKILIDETEQTDHSSSLEVLRGIAAFLVFGAHSTMYFGLAPGRVIAGGMGNIGVLLFFMLTGHLFWGQLRAKKFDANTFFTKRIRRLVPIMVLVITVYTFLDWTVAGFPIPTAHQILSIIRNFGFGFGKVVNSLGDVNDVFSKDMYLKINVIWSLRWEWMFYLCMPIFAALSNFKNITIFSIIIILLFMDPLQIHRGQTDAVFVIAFWLGALSSSLESYKEKFLSIIFKKKIYTTILIIGVIATLTYFLGRQQIIQRNIRVPIMVFLIFPIFFYFVALKTEKLPKYLAQTQILGKISYSIYLWHLGVCTYTVNITAYLFGNQQQTWWCFVLTTTLAMAITVVISLYTYKFIEKPYINKNKSVKYLHTNQ